MLCNLDKPSGDPHRLCTQDRYGWGSYMLCSFQDDRDSNKKSNLDSPSWDPGMCHSQGMHDWDRCTLYTLVGYGVG